MVDPWECAGVYCIICWPRHRVYVGATPKVLRRRVGEHCTALDRGNHFCEEMQADFNLWGEHQFETGVIATVPEDIPHLDLLYSYEYLHVIRYAQVGSVYNGMRLPEDLKAAEQRGWERIEQRKLALARRLGLTDRFPA